MKHTEPVSKGRKEIYLELLRILATFLVLFIHTNQNGFVFFTVARESVFFPLYLFCSIFSKIAVPTFFMISGALLLKKDEPIRVVFQKRISRIFLALVICSFVTYLLKADEFSLKEFLQKLYSSNLVTPYWYLYAYLGYLVMLPLLRKLSRNMQPADYLYMTGVLLFFSVLRIFDFRVLDNALHLNPDFVVFFTGIAVYYPLMGDFLANKVSLSDLTFKKVLLTAAIGLLGIAVCGIMTCAWCTHLGEWKESSCQKFLNIVIYLPVCAVFLCTRFLCARLPSLPRFEKAVTFIGAHTFGIYLFEWLYRQETRFIFDLLKGRIPTFLACLGWIFCAFALGFMVTFVIKKIPGLKKLF